MVLELIYTTEEGSEKKKQFEEDAEEVNLNELGITNIDLKQLKFFKNLKILTLSRNPITKIDLSPLSHCRNLHTLKFGTLKITEVDLTPLAQCKKLSVLRLGYGHITEIDLTPLSKCTELEEIGLSGLQLQSINLTPLGHCTSLEYLDLNGNQLQTIDLTPLSNCENLRSLKIADNKFVSLDLDPISSCKNLHGISVGANPLQHLDLTPIMMSPLLSIESLLGYQLGIAKFPLFTWVPYRLDDLWRYFNYSRPLGSHSWSFLHEVAVEYGENWLVQQDILYAMGLGKYGFIDRNLHEVLIAIDPDTLLIQAQQEMTDIVSKEVATAVDEGRSTIGLDIETLSQDAQLAIRVQKILDLRQREMQQIQLEVVDEKVDLSQLLLTAYGYQILSVMMHSRHPIDFGIYSQYSIDFKIHVEAFEEIQKIFAKMGYSLKLSNTSKTVVQMSDDLKDCI